MNSKLFIKFIILLFLILISFIVFDNGFSGGFIFDDYPNIVDNYLLKITSLSFDSLSQAYHSGIGGSNRPLSMLSFGINYYFSQLNPYYYKVTNVSIHLINAFSVSFLFYLLFNTTSHSKEADKTQLFYISLFISTLWLFHPYNLSTVLYIVQRMTMLSAFFVIWSLIFYLIGRNFHFNNKIRKGWIYIALSLFVIFPGMLCKENAILTPLFLLLIEIFLLKFYYPTSNSYNKKIIPLFFIIIVGLPFIAVLVYLTINPEFILNGYNKRDFTLLERILSESRIILVYIQQIILPNPQTMGFFSDDIELSKSIISPLTTLFSLISIFLILFLSWLYRKKNPVFAFGIFFFFTGHLLESTIIPLELMFEHRNYLPGLGIILSMTSLFIGPINKQGRHIIHKPAILLSWVIFCSFVFFIRIDSWSSPLKFALTQVANHPNSARAHSFLARHYFNYKNSPEFAQKSLFHYQKSAQLDQKMIAGLLSQILVYSKIKTKVPEKLIQQIENRLASNVITPSTINNMTILAKCVSLKECHISEEQYISLVNHLLTNKKLSTADKGTILNKTAIYYGFFLKENHKALYYIQLALKARPGDTSIWLNHALLLADKQLFKQSLDVLKKGQAIARTKYQRLRFEKQIKIIQAQISKQEK